MLQHYGDLNEIIRNLNDGKCDKEKAETTVITSTNTLTPNSPL
jgi:hypothetical protein